MFRGLVSGLHGRCASRFLRHDVDFIYGTVRLIERDTETTLAGRISAALASSSTFTSTMTGGDRVRSGTFRRLIDIAIAYRGSYFLTYHRYANRGQVLACYPQFEAFWSQAQLRSKRGHSERLVPALSRNFSGRRMSPSIRQGGRGEPQVRRPVDLSRSVSAACPRSDRGIPGRAGMVATDGGMDSGLLPYSVLLPGQIVLLMVTAMVPRGKRNSCSRVDGERSAGTVVRYAATRTLP